MKKLVLLAAMTAALGLGASQARANSTNAITLRFSLAAYTQQTEVTVTNKTSTNSIVALNKQAFTTPDLLKLLETEFKTTFPAGAQLGMDLGNRLVVLDKAGVVILDASANPADSSFYLSISNNANSIYTGRVTETSKGTTQVLKVLEPDFALYYSDGNTNNFHFGGLAMITANAVSTTNGTVYKNVSLVVQGCSGGGTFFNPEDNQSDNVAFTGVLTGSAAVLPESSN